MVRRIVVYPEGHGLETLNLVSTAGAFMLAAGVAVIVIDLIRNFRPTVSEMIGDIWQAGTLEWTGQAAYSTRSIPFVTSREPLWDQPALAKDIEEKHALKLSALKGEAATAAKMLQGALDQFKDARPPGLD